MHTSVAIIICENICLAILQAHFCNFPKVERVYLDCHRRDCGVVHRIHSSESPESHQSSVKNDLYFTHIVTRKLHILLTPLTSSS